MGEAELNINLFLHVILIFLFTAVRIIFLKLLKSFRHDTLIRRYNRLQTIFVVLICGRAKQTEVVYRTHRSFSLIIFTCILTPAFTCPESVC